MDDSFYQKLSPGDLVHLREWDDVHGWVTKSDIVFMVVEHKQDATGEFNRDIVRAVGGDYNIETFGGYFVKVKT